MNEMEPQGAPLLVLIVEDEWAARSYLTELVSQSGLAEVVAAVPSAEQARQVISAAPTIDAAFLDIHLAGDLSASAGLDLARELSQSRSAPLLVVASAAQQHALMAFELGVSDYLVKPFSADRVTQCLTRLRARAGRYDLDLSLSAIEASVGAGFLRVHRSWLVHLDHVRGLDREEGESSLLVGDELDGPHRPLIVPVARERAQVVREHLLASATRLRKL